MCALLQGSLMGECQKCELRIDPFRSSCEAEVFGKPWNQRRWSACVLRTRLGVETRSNGREVIGGFPHRSLSPVATACLCSTTASGAPAPYGSQSPVFLPSSLRGEMQVSHLVLAQRAAFGIIAINLPGVLIVWHQL